MNYRIKHTPTGLYYTSGNELSKKGKIYKKEGDNILEKDYSQESHGNKDSKSCSPKGFITVRVYTEKSPIYKMTKEIITWEKCEYKGMFLGYTADLPKSEFEIEPYVD